MDVVNFMEHNFGGNPVQMHKVHLLRWTRLGSVIAIWEVNILRTTGNILLYEKPNKAEQSRRKAVKHSIKPSIMQHQIRSKTNFVLQAISKYEAGIRKTESQVISTNDIVATVGFRYERTKEVKWVVRRSLIFGTEWEVRVKRRDLNNAQLKQAIRDEIQCDWWLKNWVNNSIKFKKAEREEARFQRNQRQSEGCAPVEDLNPVFSCLRQEEASVNRP